jgi:hypothetical protein
MPTAPYLQQIMPLCFGKSVPNICFQLFQAPQYFICASKSGTLMPGLSSNCPTCFPCASIGQSLSPGFLLTLLMSLKRLCWSINFAVASGLSSHDWQHSKSSFHTLSNPGPFTDQSLFLVPQSSVDQEPALPTCTCLAFLSYLGLSTLPKGGPFISSSVARASSICPLRSRTTRRSC